jgi:hypothetical protein
MIELYNPTSVPSRVISVFRALAKISSLSCRSGLLISSGSEGQIEQGDITGQSNISASFCASLLSWCPSSARCGVWLSVLQLDIGWLLVAWINLYLLRSLFELQREPLLEPAPALQDAPVQVPGVPIQVPEGASSSS